MNTDHTAGLVQWLCWCGTILAVYSLSRKFGPRNQRHPALFAALAFAVFPQVLLQSSSTQNDLVHAFFISCAFLFALEILSPNCWTSGMLLSAAAVGLAVGTKPMALLLLPGYGLVFIVAIVIQKPTPWKRVSQAMIACLLAIWLFGSYFYLQNLRVYGAPSGARSMTAITSVDHPGFRTISANFGRFVIQFLSPGGSFPTTGSLRAKLTQQYRTLADATFRILGIPKDLPGIDFIGAQWAQFQPLAIHEDFSWFGPIFGFIGLPILFYVIVRRAQNNQPCAALKILALTAISYLVLLATVLRWNPWFGRYMIPMVALAAPALTPVYRESTKRLSHITNGVFIGICIVSACTTSLCNEMKPLVGNRTIWGKSRIELLTWAKPSIEPMARFVDQMGLRGLRLGLVPPHENEFEYAFFGKNYERKVIPILFDRKELINIDRLPQVDYLLFLGESQRYFLTARSEFAMDAVIGQSDLHPLLAALRAPGSGWHVVLDIDDAVHLFRREELEFRPYSLQNLPDYIPGLRKWDDGWVSREFTAHVRMDPAKPTLFLRGEAPDLGVKPTLEVFSPDGETLKRLLLPGPGPFSLTLPLDSLVSKHANDYVSLRFTSNLSFNPKRLGQSEDDRDLSWRLLEMRLGAAVSALANPPTRPDYLPEFTWYPDKWVQQHFVVQIRRDPSHPFLEFRGDMQFFAGIPELKVLYKGAVLGKILPHDAGIFTSTIALKPVIDGCTSEYCPIEFDANTTFNPKKLGQSGDDRDLSWRLYEIKLVQSQRDK
ncbi:MAG: glycosyltransferase family 39 protein [Acidobacteriota bacterium]